MPKKEPKINNKNKAKSPKIKNEVKVKPKAKSKKIKKTVTSELKSVSKRKTLYGDKRRRQEQVMVEEEEVLIPESSETITERISRLVKERHNFRNAEKRRRVSLTATEMAVQEELDRVSELIKNQYLESQSVDPDLFIKFDQLRSKMKKSDEVRPPSYLGTISLRDDDTHMEPTSGRYQEYLPDDLKRIMSEYKNRIKRERERERISLLERSMSKVKI